MNFFKSLSIYTTTSILNSAIPFFLLPILTSYLTAQEYGLLAIIQIFIIFTIPFISINIQSTLQLEYNELDKDEFALWISSILIIPLVTLLLVCIAFVLFESFIYTFINVSLLWMLIIPLIAFMQIVPQTLLSIYRISERPIDYAKYQLALTSINLLLTIVLIVFLHFNWEGRVLAILFTYILFTILGLYTLVKMKFIVLKIDKVYIKKLLD